MARTYETLLNAIDDYIIRNGIQAITGDILHDVLIQCVKYLGSGMRFMGVASPNERPESSEYPKFYIALTPGSYRNAFDLSGNVTRLINGIGILTDYTGLNTWSMNVWNMPANSSIPQFVVDACVLKNEYSGGTILYVDQASKQNNISSFSIKRTNTNGDDFGTVARYSVNNVESGIKSYELPLVDTRYSTIKISVDWDLVQNNSTSVFDLSEPIPQSAFAKQSQTTSTIFLNALAIEYDTQGYFYGIVIPDDSSTYLTRTQIANLINTNTVYLTSTEQDFQNMLLIPKNSSCFYILNFESADSGLEYKSYEYHHTANNIEYWKNYTRVYISA